MKNKKQFSLKVLMIAMAFIFPAQAEWWKLPPSILNENSTVVLAKCLAVEDKTFGIVLKEEEDFPPDPNVRAIELNAEILQSALGVLDGAPYFELNLYLEEKNPTKIQINAARKKDLQARNEGQEALGEELQRVGLKVESENDRIVYFSSGKSDLRVTRPLDGGLTSDDEFTVTWKNIALNVSRPTLLPSSSGEVYGLAFSKAIEPGQNVAFENSFLRKDQADQAIRHAYHHRAYLTVKSKISNYFFETKRGWEKYPNRLNTITIFPAPASKSFILVVDDTKEVHGIHVPQNFPHHLNISPATIKYPFTQITFDKPGDLFSPPFDGIQIHGNEIRFLNDADFARMNDMEKQTIDEIKAIEKLLNEMVRQYRQNKR